MPESSTRGQVSAKTSDELIVFKPAGTSYELHLRTSAPYDGPLDEPISARIRVQARKVYTVPSGGNFISPIFGTPRIIQGRVKAISGQSLVVQSGAIVTADLPPGELAIDLNNGQITVGAMVNIVVMPGATIEFATSPRLSRAMKP